MNTVVYTDSLSRRELEPTTPWGRWIRDVYKGAGLTQDEFADKIGRHRQTVTSWKKGEFEPKRDAVELIMRKFPKAPPPPPAQPIENHTPAQIPQARAAAGAPAVQVTVQVTKPANFWGLMTAIADWARSVGAPNPFEDSEFGSAISSAWNEYEKRSKALAKR